MNTIKITNEFSPEDRKLLEGLMGSITLLASVLGNALPKEAQQQIIQEVHGSDHPIDAATAHLEPVDAPAPTPAAEPASVESAPVTEPPAAEPASVESAPVTEPPKAEVIPYAEFQKAVTQAVAKGPKQKAAAKEIINKYAASVSAVPEDKRAEVMAELAKI